MVKVRVDVISISQFSFHLDDVGAKVIRIKPAMRDSKVELFDCKCLRRDLRTLKMQKQMAPLEQAMYSRMSSRDK